MRKCIYCKELKPKDVFSLEHIIPQFLGGSCSPDIFKTRDVCATCNNNLGLFVDAAFEKDFLVHNNLKIAARAFFNPDKPTSIPLQNMGISKNLTPPGLKDNEVCEIFLGPFGEQIILIRPKDERLYWYTGGNPRTAKTVSSQAYFMFSINSSKNALIACLSFKNSFSGKKVKKIMCTSVENIDLKSMGFSEPDDLDIKRITYFLNESKDSGPVNCGLSMYIDYDIRFLAKLGIGISYSLFGDKILTTKYAKELHSSLWHRQGEEKPDILYTSALSEEKNDLTDLCGIHNAVTITIMPIVTGVVINLNINAKLNWSVVCATMDDLDANDIILLGDGLCFVFFSSIKQVVELSLPNFIAHNSGNIPNPELTEINKLNIKNDLYFKSLKVEAD